MSDQNSAQRMALKRPANDDKDGWKAYWKVQAQSWRREPEIDAERQKHLAVLRSIVPDITNGIYPFSHINLNRADVEWLLATHEGLRGPIDWSDKSQRDREGLDLRGANLRGLDSSSLPGMNLKHQPVTWRALISSQPIWKMLDLIVPISKDLTCVWPISKALSFRELIWKVRHKERLTLKELTFNAHIWKGLIFGVPF